MPALNIMAIHDSVENSVVSPSRASGILPYRPKASTSENATNPVAPRMNSQPKVLVTQLRRAPATSVTCSVKKMPSRQTTTIMPPETKKTVLSTVFQPRSPSSASSAAVGKGPVYSLLIMVLTLVTGTLRSPGFLWLFDVKRPGKYSCRHE